MWRTSFSPCAVHAANSVSWFTDMASCHDVAAVVRLRFYAGLSVEETAEALGISPRTVKREWTYARARLFRELTDDDR